MTLIFWFGILMNVSDKNWQQKYQTKKKRKKVLTLIKRFDILDLLTWKREQEWSLKTEQNVNSLLARIWTNFKKINNFFGEFDPGSGWTLAACLRHASRTRWPFENCVLVQSWIEILHLVADGWVTHGWSALKTGIPIGNDS